MAATPSRCCQNAPLRSQRASLSDTSSAPSKRIGSRRVADAEQPGSLWEDLRVDVQRELSFAFELADGAARLSLPRFTAGAFEVETKPDGSPVTQVDLEVERLLCERIAARRGGDTVVGEESGHSVQEGSRWLWYLDPIDGTKRFVAADPKWMTLIALAYDEEMIVGVVDYPALGQRWWASRGHGAFSDGKRLHVSDVAQLKAATICDDWRKTIAAAADHEHPVVRVAGQCAHVRPHQGHASLAVAAGRADIAISTGSHSWDYAAPSIIVSEAGGRQTDFAGGPHLDRGQAVVTNGHLHDEVLASIDPTVTEPA